MQSILLQGRPSSLHPITTSHPSNGATCPPPYDILSYPLLRAVGVPRARIAHGAATRALALATELLWQVLRRDLFEQLREVVLLAAEDLNLRDGGRVEPGLDDVPGAGESPGGVDDVELAHRLRVAVLADAGRLEDVVLDLEERHERDVVQIEDRARGLDRVPDHLRACGESLVQELLVFVDEPLQLALWVRDLVERFNIEKTETLDVDRAALLWTW